MSIEKYNADVAKENNVIYGPPDKDSTINGTDENDTIYALSGDDTVYAGMGNDLIYGGGGNDTLFGQDGDDVVFGNAGDDTLNGGKGNDHMVGGLGSDSYHYNLGDEIDSINNYASDHEITSDTLFFGKGIKPSDLIVTKESIRGKGDFDLKIAFAGSQGDALYLENAFTGSINENQYVSDNSKLNAIQFVDGTIWSMDTLLEHMNINNINGTEGNDAALIGETKSINTINGLGGNDYIYGGDNRDYLYGDDGDDFIYGGKGDDYLYGGKGNDILDGGFDNNWLEGGEGADTYIIDTSLGYGTTTINNYATDNLTGPQDTIRFEGNITPADLIITRESNRGKEHCDLKIFIDGTDQVIYIQDAFADHGDHSQANMEASKLKEIIFVEQGVSWTMNDLLAHANLIYDGREQDQTLFGNAYSNDIINGFDGNDVIYALAGDDTLYGGNGNDTIFGGDGNDTIYGGNDNDILYGNNGNDILIGGKGNDHLAGGRGNDTYVFNRGDGTDTIDNYADDHSTTQDILQFGNNISASDLILTRESNRGKDDYDLKIQIKGSDGDAIYLENAFAGINNKNQYFYDNSKLHQIQFKDGTVWNMNNLRTQMVELTALEETPAASRAFSSTQNPSIESNLSGLINAMASFDIPSAGISTFGQSGSINLDMVLTASV